LSPSRPPKQASTPPTQSQPPSPKQPERLQKLLAAAGLGSRREIESWIEAGRVTVAGRVAQLGERATALDEIAVDGKRVELSAGSGRVLLYHKPVGELVTRNDPQGRATVFSRLPPGRWVAVGRLDMNSSGLLLFTDDGELANRLMHPRYEVEREYLARVQGPVDIEKLKVGVTLEDGPAAFDRIDLEKSGEGANRWYRVALREGRNREVRRIFEAVGARVSRLTRVRYGPVELPRDLAPGQWRELRNSVIVQKLCSGGSAK
jgi:23S rRNA pseudouridine2605 synthase